MLSTGDRAPAFELKDAAGASVSLENLAGRRPALLAFFKASCPVCQMTLPYLERLAAGGKLAVIGVSQDDASTAAAFNRRFGVTFPTLFDRAKDGYPASNAFGITNVPSLFLLEHDGTIGRAVMGWSKRDIEALEPVAGAKAILPGEQVAEWRAG